MTLTKKPTPERIEYEEAAKNLRFLDLKAKLSEEGIDTSKVPRQLLDDILRSLEAQNAIYRASQSKIQVIQLEAQNTINEIAKTGETIVESLRAKYGYAIAKRLEEDIPATHVECESNKDVVN